MNKVITLPKEKTIQAELIQQLKSIGYSDDEVCEALTFIDENPLNDPPPEPPKNKKPNAQVIEFPRRMARSFKNAA